MNKCKTCKHSVFKEKWGEWKCLERGYVIYDPKRYEHCDKYEPKNKSRRKK